MKLHKIKTLTIIPSSPFAFDPTFHKPDHFTSADNLWQPGTRWQTWRWQGIPLGLKFMNHRTPARPKIAIDVFAGKRLADEFIASLLHEIKYRYNLDLDLNPFYRQFNNDAHLSRVIRKWRGMRPGHPSSLYEYLIIGIMLQNAPVRRSVQMLKALLERYGTPLEFDSKKLWCFWNPGRFKKVAENDLRALKLGYRAKSIKKIDEQFVHKHLSEHDLRTKTSDEQMAVLLNLYGVGPTTVWYLLFDVFHRWDFFNHISPWEQKIYSKLFFNRSPEHPVPIKKLLRYFDRFDAYKQLAVHYIWEDLWWQRTHRRIPWLEKEIRI